MSFPTYRLSQVAGAIIALDYTKAFDSISRHFIMKSLEQFNFGHDFIRWVEVYTQDTQSAVINYGWVTDWFDLDKGIRQGCPLSALLFIMGIELFACKIKQARDIKGFKVPGSDSEIRITQYADDNTIFVSNKQ